MRIWTRVVPRTLASMIVWIVVGMSLNASPPSLDGFWLSDGYGYLAQIAGERLDLLEITPVSCLSHDTFTRQLSPADSRGIRFISIHNAEAILLSPGPDTDSEWLHNLGAASSILFHRTGKRPVSCAETTRDDPESNFEIFWQTFAAHHGFMEHRGVNWDAIYREYRPKVAAQTKPGELFDTFAAMIEPLHDAHTSIRAPDLARAFHGKRPGTLLLTDTDKQRTIEILENGYLADRLRYWCRGHIGYGRLKQGAGYLRIDAFAGYTDSGGFEEGARALDAALDEIMKDAQTRRGLVIDVRINGGGDDPYGVQVAGRLTRTSYVAFVKRARNDPRNRESWTAPQESIVQVTDRPRFLGRVVELMGSDTVSAGETFTMALMGRPPHVVRVGDNTQGVYSDVLGRRLPNGWRFGLPNEVFLTESGVHFEARGVAPDVRAPVFSNDDLGGRRDSALEKALAILSEDSVLLLDPVRGRLSSR